MVAFLVPPPLWKHGGVTYSCTVTPASLAPLGVTGFGYYNDGAGTTIGSISAEPLPTFQLEFVARITSPSSVSFVQFVGDASALLAGLSVYIAGTKYSSSSGWEFNGTYTEYYADGSFPFTNTTARLVEIKP